MVGLSHQKSPTVINLLDFFTAVNQIHGTQYLWWQAYMVLKLYGA